MRWFVYLFMVLFLFPGPIWAQVRIKDIARIQGLKDNQLIGYGLVVGLDGTGDTNYGQNSSFTVQSVVNMLSRFGIVVPLNRNRLRLRNVAAVMVTADLPAYAKRGAKIDVVVSSLGDATSLRGGTLLLTPLVGVDGTVYAYAQGAVSVGGFSVRTIGGEEVRRNYTLVGRVPGGAVVEKGLDPVLAQNWKLNIALNRPDFTTALRISQAISDYFGSSLAVAQDAGIVSVEVPVEYQNRDRLTEFIATVENLSVIPDQAARVVINERTGTIVVGEKVTISTCAVSHGNLNIEIGVTPVISQPPPLSEGQTVVVLQTQTLVTMEQGQFTVIQEAATVGDVAQALNALGVTPQDIIAIFQALKEAGALQAELIIM